MTEDTKTAADRMVPLTRATVLWRLSREMIMRRIALGEIEAEQRGRYWFVMPPDERPGQA